MAQILKSTSRLAKEAKRGKILLLSGIILAIGSALLHLTGSYYFNLIGTSRYITMLGFGGGIVLYQMAKQHYGACIAGVEGEKKVATFLAKELSDDWLLLNDVEIKSNNKTAQIDHVLVGPYGIVLIETKNVKGRISLTGDKQYWCQDKKYDTKEFYSPTLQARGHEAAVKSIVSLFNLNQFIPIRSIALFCDDQIELSLPRFVDGIPVKSMVTLAALDFTGGKEPVLNQQLVEYIGQTFLAIHGEPVSVALPASCRLHEGKFGI